MNNFRAATNDDASFIIPLISESSGGVSPAIWKALAKDGESLEASATRDLCDPNSNVSIQNAMIAELDEARVGVMITYQEAAASQKAEVSAANQPLPKALQEALQPFREISDPSSLFISELCCLPEARGQGIGTQFLEHAKAQAIERKLPRVTLRVFSANTGAVRLYERYGFRVADERQLIPHPDIKFSGSVFLMSCDV